MFIKSRNVLLWWRKLVLHYPSFLVTEIRYLAMRVQSLLPHYYFTGLCGATLCSPHVWQVYARDVTAVPLYARDMYARWNPIRMWRDTEHHETAVRQIQRSRESDSNGKASRDRDIYSGTRFFCIHNNSRIVPSDLHREAEKPMYVRNIIHFFITMIKFG